MKLPNGYGSVSKLSGKRRYPYVVRKTVGYHYDEEKDKIILDSVIIGYAKSKAEGLNMLAEYNNNPYDAEANKLTFSDIYKRWSEEKFPLVSEASIKSYEASYKDMSALHNKKFADLKLKDLQDVIDSSDKNYPMIKKMKILLNQMYKYAMKYDLVGKDYAKYVEIAKHKKEWQPKYDEEKHLEMELVNKLWSFKDDFMTQTILMLIYSGPRIGEMLEVRLEDVNLEERCFYIRKAKTNNGIRPVPIADVVYPFFKKFYESSKCGYLFHREDGSKWNYDNYRDRFVAYFKPLGLYRTPHCTRHTCISMLTAAYVDERFIKKIVGHSGNGNVTEKVYTHLEIKELRNEINKLEALLPATSNMKKDATQCE